MTAAIYARKLTRDERSAKNGKSVDRQEELAREFCAAQGWAVASVHVDDGISVGDFVNRPGFVAMIVAARRRPKQPAPERRPAARSRARSLTGRGDPPASRWPAASDIA